MKYPAGTQILNKKEEEESDRQSINPFEDAEQESVPKASQKRTKKVTKNKKSKKSKKEKKSKKQVKAEQDQDSQYEEEYERNSMFDDEAESGEEDEQDGQCEAQFGYEEKKDRYEETYKKSNIERQFMQRFEGKDERQINAQYSKKALMVRKKQQQFPSQKDPKIFVLKVQRGRQEEMVLKILNKAKHLNIGKLNADKQKQKVTIISAMARKKIFPGKIFVEAFTEWQVRQYLEDFVPISMPKKKPLEIKPKQRYSDLFYEKKPQKIYWKVDTFVRINHGPYEGDLAKVFKIKKNSVDVLIVPRINMQEAIKRIQPFIANMKDQNKIRQKKQEFFKLLIDHRRTGNRNIWEKKPLYAEEYMKYKDTPGIDRVRLAPINGLIILNYQPGQLRANTGTFLPVDLLPFLKEGGNFMEEIKEEIHNMGTLAQLKTGELVEILSGQLRGTYGELINIKEGVGVIKGKSKSVKGLILEEPLGNLTKFFKEGDEVKVISGSDKGKAGIVLSIYPKEIEIWTDNSHSIKANRKCVALSSGEVLCLQNTCGLKRLDLIRTKTKAIGIVIKTTKESIHMIDTNNVIQVVKNYDFDQVIKSRYLVAKNKRGDEIKFESSVMIEGGINQGKKCKVLHVYQQHVFMHHIDLNRRPHIYVENADNCRLTELQFDDQTFRSNRAPGACHFLYDQPQELKPGSIIVIHTGEWKGSYGRIREIMKTHFYVQLINRDVRIGVPRKRLIRENSEQQQLNYHDEDRGRTPNRNLQSQKGFSQPSPARDDE